jgi:phage/plasmid-like protein (TIGR03299 family)
MAHELDFAADGTVAMAFRIGDPVPWHAAETNPQTVEVGASIEDWAIAAGLDYSVEIAPNCKPDGSPIGDSYHIARTDTGAVTGPYIAGQWQPVQNAAALELADDIRRAHGYDIVTAGALFGGSKIWLQLEADADATLPGGDRITSRPLFSLSHTGRDANTFASVNTRVVCNNTLTAALAETGADIVRHDHRVMFEPAAVETALGLNAERFAGFADMAQRMATRALSDAEALEFFRDVIGGKETAEEGGKVRWSIGVRRAMAFHRGQEFVPVGKADDLEVAARVSERLDQIARGVATPLPADATADPVATINPGHDMESARGTLWGAFNTVTWLADQRPAKNRGAAHGIASNLFGDGTGGKLKAKAHRKALELLTV